MTRVCNSIIIPATAKIYSQGNISGNKTLIHGANSPASDEVKNFLAGRSWSIIFLLFIMTVAGRIFDSY